MLSKKLEQWCEKNNAVEQAEKFFWEHFDEFKRIKLEDFSKYEIQTVKLFVENVGYEILLEEKENIYLVQLYATIDGESVGDFKVIFSEDGSYKDYEIW